MTGVCAVVMECDVDNLSRRRWFTRAVRVQGYGLVERILSSKLENRLGEGFQFSTAICADRSQ